MKGRYLVFILFTLILAGIGAQPQQGAQRGSALDDEIIVFRLPDPERVYIYRDGSVVYEATIQSGAIINNTFILPENARLESLSIFQDGRRIYTYTTFTAEALVMLRRGEMPRQVRVLHVTIPDLRAGVTLDVKYGIRSSGLSWNLLLDLEVLAGSNLNSALIAELRASSDLPEMTRSILARSPEIILASTDNALLEDGAAVFNLGRPQIEAGKRRLINLEEGRTRYQIVYHWDANRRERPSAYLRAATPLRTMAGWVQYNLNSGGIIIDSGSLTMSPDRPFNIHVGEQPNIVTFKSIITAEFPERETHPFTHNLEYRVENQSGTAIDLELSVPVAVGIRHRTEYTFTTPPDERPGGRLLWRYHIRPGEEIVLQFSFETDLKDDPSYRQFDYSEGNGR